MLTPAPQLQCRHEASRKERVAQSRSMLHSLDEPSHARCAETFAVASADTAAQKVCMLHSKHTTQCVVACTIDPAGVWLFDRQWPGKAMQ